MAAKTIALHGVPAGKAGSAAPGKLDARIAGALRGDFGRWRLRAGRSPQPDPVPVQPQGTVDLEVGEVATLERARRQDCGHAGVQRSRPLQAHSRALLRCHPHAGRQRRRPRRAALLLLCADHPPGKKEATPPLVVLQWGAVRSFVAFVASVQAKYTLFTGEGTPIRATCNVSLEEMPGDPRKQNPTSGGLTLNSVRTVVAGDSLASIAYREYGDPAMWRPLAALQRHRRPSAASGSARRCSCPLPTSSWRKGVTWPRRRSATPSR